MVILMSEMLKCQVCDYTEPIPIHCNQPMHVESVEGVEKLVCWMGPDCGVKVLPSHHEKTMKIISIDE